MGNDAGTWERGRGQSWLGTAGEVRPRRKGTTWRRAALGANPSHPRAEARQLRAQPLRREAWAEEDALGGGGAWRFLGKLRRQGELQGAGRQPAIRHQRWKAVLCENSAREHAELLPSPCCARGGKTRVSPPPTWRRERRKELERERQRHTGNPERSGEPGGWAGRAVAQALQCGGGLSGPRHPAPQAAQRRHGKALSQSRRGSRSSQALPGALAVPLLWRGCACAWEGGLGGEAELLVQRLLGAVVSGVSVSPGALGAGRALVYPRQPFARGGSS